jgi:predicted CoA-binding protein
MKTIAVVGASNDRRKFGNKCVRAYLRAGWRVFPVNINPRETEVEGLPTFTRVSDVPDALDRISVYLPPPVTLELLPDFAAKGAGEVWMNPGAADRAVIDEAKKQGIPVVEGCSIVDVGFSPSQFP